MDYNIQNPSELALALKAKWDLHLNGGFVIANPIPEKYEMDFDIITDAINKAVEEAKKLGIKGKESTPFLLAKVKELTGGSSLKSNIELVYNNAKLAAKLAVEYSKL
jgi:pseudouridine-5'-phosphate glycosidase